MLPFFQPVQKSVNYCRLTRREFVPPRKRVQSGNPDAAMLRDRMLKYIENGVQIVNVNMSDLDFIDSTGLGVLIGIHKRLIERGVA